MVESNISLSLMLNIDYSKFSSAIQTITTDLKNFKNVASELGFAFQPITTNSSNATQSLTTLDTKTQTLNTNVSNVSKQFQTFGQGITATGNAVTQLNQPIQNVTTSSERLGLTVQDIWQEMTNLSAGSGTLGQSLEQTNVSVSNLDQGLIKTDQDISKTITTVSNLDQGYTSISTTFAQLDPQLNQFNISIKEQGLAIDQNTKSQTQNQAVLEKTKTTTDNTKTSTIQLTSSLIGVASTGYAVYNAIDQLEKVMLRAEKANIAFERVTRQTSLSLQNISKLIEDTGSNSTQLINTYNQLANAQSQINALLEAGAIDTVELNSAVELSRSLQEQLKNQLISLGVSQTDVNNVMSQYALILDKQLAAAQAKVIAEGDVLEAQVQAVISVMGSLATIIATVITIHNSLATAQKATTVATTAQTGAQVANNSSMLASVPIIGSVSTALRGLSTSMRAVLIATGVGAAIVALGYAFEFLLNKADESKDVLETTVDSNVNLVNSYDDVTKKVAESRVELESFSKALKNLASGGVIANTSDLQGIIKILNDVKQAKKEILEPKAETGTSILGVPREQLGDIKILSPLAKNTGEVISSTSAYENFINTLKGYIGLKKEEKDVTVADTSALTESLNKSSQQFNIKQQEKAANIDVIDTITQITDARYVEINTTQQAANVLTGVIKSRLADREVTLQNAFSIAQLNKDVNEGKITYQQYIEELDKIAPLRNKLILLEQKQISQQTLENDTLLEQARMLGISEGILSKFIAKKDEMTGKNIQNSATIKELNNDLKLEIAQHIDVTESLTNETKIRELNAQATLSGTQKAQDYVSSLVIQKKETETYVNALLPLAKTLNIDLPSGFLESKSNVELMTSAIIGGKQEIEKLAEAILNAQPTILKLGEIGQKSFKDFFDQKGKITKEFNEVFRFLPESVKKEIKANLKIKYNTEELHEEFRQTIANMFDVVVNQDTGKLTLKLKGGFDDKDIKKTIDSMIKEIKDKLDLDLPANAPFAKLVEEFEKAKEEIKKGADPKIVFEKLINNTENLELLVDLIPDFPTDLKAQLIEVITGKKTENASLTIPIEFTNAGGETGGLKSRFQDNTRIGKGDEGDGKKIVLPEIDTTALDSLQLKVAEIMDNISKTIQTKSVGFATSMSKGITLLNNQTGLLSDVWALELDEISATIGTKSTAIPVAMQPAFNTMNASIMALSETWATEIDEIKSVITEKSPDLAVAMLGGFNTMWDQIMNLSIVWYAELDEIINAITEKSPSMPVAMQPAFNTMNASIMSLSDTWATEFEEINTVIKNGSDLFDDSMKDGYNQIVNMIKALSDVTKIEMTEVNKELKTGSDKFPESIKTGYNQIVNMIKALSDVTRIEVGEINKELAKIDTDIIIKISWEVDDPPKIEVGGQSIDVNVSVKKGAHGLDFYTEPYKPQLIMVGEGSRVEHVKVSQAGEESFLESDGNSGTGTIVLNETINIDLGDQVLTTRRKRLFDALDQK